MKPRELNVCIPSDSVYVSLHMSETFFFFVPYGNTKKTKERSEPICSGNQFFFLSKSNKNAIILIDGENLTYFH